MSKLFKTFMTVAVFAGLTVVSSCTKTCDEGFEGEKCDTEIRAKFVGQFQGSETCTVGTDNYTVTITTSATDVLKVTFNNVYNAAYTATATVDGSAFTVANQTVATGVTVQGSGTISGDNLTFTYTIDGAANNTCTFTGTKL